MSPKIDSFNDVLLGVCPYRVDEFFLARGKDGSRTARRDRSSDPGRGLRRDSAVVSASGPRLAVSRGPIVDADRGARVQSGSPSTADPTPHLRCQRDRLVGVKHKRFSADMTLQWRSDMPHRLLDKARALVTGASSGIGAAIARAFADAGASVIVNYRSSQEAAERIAKEIRQDGGDAIAVQGDVSNPENCSRLFTAAIQKLGGIDVVVANAGLQRDAAFTDMALEDWQKVIDVNLTGQFLCAQEAVRCFRRQGLDPARSPAMGKIVFTNSVHQVIPWAGHANYAAAKGGIETADGDHGARTGKRKDPGQCNCARRDRNRDQQGCMGQRGRTATAAQTDSVWPYRRTAGYRQGRRVAGFRRVRLCGRHHTVRRWRHAAISGIPGRRMTYGI